MDYIPAKTLISNYMKDNMWFGTNYNMNIYKGCSHGCIYCDSRSECYGVDNFDQVRAKENALALIERDLKSKRRKGVVGTGAMSDPYNPMERKHELTRGALRLVNQYGFGIAIATKSDLIIRDIDLLKDIAKHSPVLVKITITTADDTQCKKIEPNVCNASHRFHAIRQLSNAGIYVGILLMPVLPFIEDNENNVTQIIEGAHKSGAKFIYPAFGVTLRQNQRDWYYDKLDKLYPSVKEQYITRYGNSYQCSSPNAKELWKIFRTQCDKSHILYRMDDIIHGYKDPYEWEQISMFTYPEV